MIVFACKMPGVLVTPAYNKLYISYDVNIHHELAAVIR